MVRLPFRQRTLARDAGEVDEGSSADHRTGIADSGSDSSSSVAGERLHRDSGPSPPASRDPLERIPRQKSVTKLTSNRVRRAFRMVLARHVFSDALCIETWPTKERGHVHILLSSDY